MSPRRSPQADAILRLNRAGAHLLKGSARATAVGIENFVKALNHENVFDRNVTKNGFLQGLIEGWTVAMFEGARLAEEAFKIWMDGVATPDEPPRRRRQQPAPNDRPGGRHPARARIS